MSSGPRLAVGLMSGTSMDGIDAALLETDGRDHVRPLAFRTVPYDADTRERLREAMATALRLRRPQPEPGIAEVERALTLAHAEAVRALLDAASVSAAAVAAVGFPGQTLAHAPDRGWTWQIGDGALLAALVGATVVDDFRSEDVAAGGEGAPLVPVYQRARVRRLRREQPRLAAETVAVLNLGGVGNVAWFGPEPDGAAWGAFDTGPGNALIDDWVREAAGLDCDRDGALAAAGAVHPDVLAGMLDLDWFDLAPPKSLDRFAFTLGPARGLGLTDGAATLTAFTAQTVVLAYRHLPAAPALTLVTGGGRRNPSLMAALGDRLGAAVEPVESVGWNGDALEAEAFAYLAVRVLEGLPTSFPETTGVPRPLSGGRIHQPRKGSLHAATR